ncbi:MAG: 3-oxoacyl-[acyl-carrier-protein] synthase-3 [Cognaticolwellia sp.]
MPNATISGTGSFVPDQVVTNDDLVSIYGIETTDEWIQKRTGIKERRFAPEGMENSDMGLQASLGALEMAGLQATDLDMLIYATLSPKHSFPGDGVYLQKKLGLCDGPNATFAPAMDIRNQCSGFLYALGTATAMVQSGACKHVLVVGSELHSAALELSTSGRSVSTLFGDGAGAVIVSATEEDKGIRHWHLGSDGRGADVLRQRVWDTSRRPFIRLDKDGNGIIPREELYANMDGRQVFKNAVQRMCFAVLRVCQEQGIQGEDIDLWFFHQANMRINQYVAKQLGIPEEKLLHNIDRYGNTTAATIPLLMDEAVRTGRLKPGMKIACVAFGSGFTWGATLIDW